ncbi:hypothetical protein ACNFJ7_02190 [Sphingomonas sp. HT-1]|uniref:phage fiber-tail adaptor protein n=1 Tax=unclassified Sphingomonas TaxID=196159 RepID=UPI00030E2A7A|nr:MULTISPECIES: hypothetical protein [unclassified Sphingomonas]KTF70702.1 hypothetical protein ATB93_18795 [Sphingomonas sp. WG]
MLTHLIALGLFTVDDGSTSQKGNVIATSDRTAVMTIVPAAVARASGLPFGAAAWAQPYDPGDHAPYAIDFSDLLDEGESIAKIEAIKVSPTAALLGIAIDESANYRPIIDVGGQKVQVWFLIDQAYWEAAQFAAGGVQLPLSVRVLTDGSPAKRYERTAVLTVRQL